MKPNITETYTSKGMRYPALNDLIAKANNKYELVLATAKRAREIIDGDEPLVKITIDNPVSIATAEIAEGLVHPVNPAIGGQAQEAAPAEDIFPENEESAAPTTAEIAEEE